MTLLAPITRRGLIFASLGVGSMADGAWAAVTGAVSVDDVAIAGSPLSVKRYAATGSAKRPAVLLLHGSKGLGAHVEAYDRYARDLAGAGTDVFVFSYFELDEAAAIAGAKDGSARQKHYARSAPRWVSLVRSIATFALSDARSSGHVGVIGFSLGGFLAVAAASTPMFSVLTVFYAGLPTFAAHAITYLPPLLDIHGSADRVVPLAEGRSLVAAAKRLGGVAELAVYPDQGHGFDLDPTTRDAASARTRAVAFTSRWLA